MIDNGPKDISHPLFQFLHCQVKKVELQSLQRAFHVKLAVARLQITFLIE